MTNTAPPAAGAATAPAAGTGAPDTSTNGGAPGTQSGTPTFKDDKERADHYEARHGEATNTIRQFGETKKQFEARITAYETKFGKIEDDKTTPPKPAADGSTLPADVWTDSKQKNWELDQQIGRIPTLVPHSQEIKDLVKGGLQLQEAKETVAKRHNITLGPVTGALDMMPHVPSGGGNTQPTTGFSNDQLDAMKRDGIDPEKAKKHHATVEGILKRARRK